ncbi:hypothetical protein ACH5RR_006036 [Cinchona calisaya]|uniref:SKI-interacting protein SKIP SNW domain-containing protein n=1 Tax=Cinchona calisaya TaxID=153742 RepID=A0ABD3AMW4_9GENT
MVVKDGKDEEEMDLDEKQKEVEGTTQSTKAALEKIVNVRLSAAQPKNVPAQSSDSKFIKYKPSQQLAAFNSGAKERIIRMVEMPVDPLEPPKFKRKRVPKASGSPPVPVMRSPPRAATVKDQQDWKIPPCISNWKNPKGYTIPLDKRLAADGRGLQDVQINDNFAKLSEALYVAEQKAREAVAMRSKVQKEMMMKEKEKKEMELRELARKPRSGRTGSAVTMPSERGEDMITDYERVRILQGRRSRRRKERSGCRGRKSVKSGAERGKGSEDWRQKMLQWGRRVRLQGIEIVTSVRKLLLEWLQLGKGVKSCMIKGCLTRRKGWTLVSPPMILITSMTRGFSLHSLLSLLCTGPRKMLTRICMEVQMSSWRR